MDYILTFDDGSSAYLAHHGVLGMKWGVRNAETRRKYAGGNGRVGGYSSGNGRQGLTEGQKRALKTAAIGLGAAAAVGGGVYLARRGALKNLGASKKLAETIAKEKHAETMKAVRNDIRLSRMGAANALMREGAPFGLSSKGANKLVAAKVRQNHKLGFRYAVPRSNSPEWSAYLIDNHSNEVQRGIRWALESRNSLQETLDTASMRYKKGKRFVDAATVAGGATAIGTGVGAGYVYNRSSKKRSGKRVR